MQNAETVLNVIRQCGIERKPLERVYRQLYNQELYLTAYGNLYANKGATTKGTTNQTVDGMSLRRIDKLIELLRNEQFRWTPVRRTYIPKKDGSQRPLGIPTWEDKLLQEVIRLLLEAYYEPKFSENSHGFRPERGCHTALEQIKYACRGTRWFIETDISKCFDKLNHEKLIEILRKDIKDERFIKVIEWLLKAGYLEEWKWNATISGTPQGGVVSPILANIYLNEMDHYIEQVLIPEYTRGEKRQRSATYRHYEYKKGHAKRNNDRKAYKAWDKRLRKTPVLDTQDPNYRRLRYVRYADDSILAFAGPRHEAEEIKQRLKEWVQTELKLEISQTKTLITHASTETARFLGYDIQTGQENSWRDSAGRRNLNGEIILRLPKDKLQTFVDKYTRNGKPIHRGELIQNSDYDIVVRYQSEYRGYVQYYQLAKNLHQMTKLRWVMETSMLKTLANKHKSTVEKMVNHYQCTIETENGPMKGFRVVIEREGKQPLIAEFGGIPLRTKEKLSNITDSVVTLGSHRTELVTRLLAETCELCGSHKDIEVHHIRKLADLNTKGRQEKPLWIQRMAALRRKTLVVCRECHDSIHAGKTRSVWNNELESRVR